MGNEQTAPSDVVIIILSLLGEGNKIPADNKFLYNKFLSCRKTLTSIFFFKILSLTQAQLIHIAKQ